MACSVELTLSNFILFGVLIFVLKKAWKLYKQWKVEKMLEKWSKSPIRDKVIFHSMAYSKTLPSISPFHMKLETYLRMAKIPYVLDTTDPTGPKGKLPWITYNGTHVPDTHFIIQFLNKKFSIDLNKNSTKEQISIARACRLMCEERFFWGILQFRVMENFASFSSLMKIPTVMSYLPVSIVTHFMKTRMEANGIGMHTPADIYEMTENDLRTISILLGTKKFLGGDTPCEDDASIFGSVAQCVWAAPGSSFERLVNGELSNIKQYCERIKETYYPDWEKLLDKS